jgi:hypothetical protein
MPGLTLDKLESNLRRHGRPLASYKIGDMIHGSGSGSRYAYRLSAEPGALEEGFNPDLSPAEMLMLGVFEGKYLNDCTHEFPS